MTISLRLAAIGIALCAIGGAESLKYMWKW